MGKIFDNINSMIMESMKNKDSVKTNAYKNIKAKFIEFKTAKNAKPLDDTAEISILNKMVAELNNDANIFKTNNRLDLAEDAINEASVIEMLLPKQATVTEINDAINEYVSENGDFDKKQMGLVVKFVKSKFANVDGSMIAKQITAYLNR